MARTKISDSPEYRIAKSHEQAVRLLDEMRTLKEKAKSQASSGSSDALAKSVDCEWEWAEIDDLAPRSLPTRNPFLRGAR